MSVRTFAQNCHGLRHEPCQFPQSRGTGGCFISQVAKQHDVAAGSKQTQARRQVLPQGIPFRLRAEKFSGAGNHFPAC